MRLQNKRHSSSPTRRSPSPSTSRRASNRTASPNGLRISPRLQRSTTPSTSYVDEDVLPRDQDSPDDDQTPKAERKKDAAPANHRQVSSSPPPSHRLRSKLNGDHGGTPNISFNTRGSRSAPSSAQTYPKETRRSGRQRKLNYASLNSDLIIDKVLGQDEEQNGFPKSNDCSEEDEGASYREVHQPRLRRRHLKTTDDDSFFDHHHVRFSPSTKPSSPSVRSSEIYSSRRQNLRRVRLQNLPSDDEQSEFNRRYSRDLRSRRKLQQQKEDGVNQVQDDDESDESSKKDHSSRGNSIRNSSMQNAHITRENDDASMDYTEEIQEEIEENAQGGIVTRRRTRRTSSTTMREPHNDNTVEEDIEANNGLRRSSRTHKPKLSASVRDDGLDDDVTSSSSSESRGKTNGHERKWSLRPRKAIVPVEKLNYETTRTTRSSRRCSEEIRNLDQYSTDDEFHGAPEGIRRRKKYNMRENRRQVTSYIEEYQEQRETRRNYRDKRPVPKEKKRKMKPLTNKDSSSSSSSENSDEERFQKRKSKRMLIERSKLMPMNLNKDDVAKAIFKDRQKVGSSLADVCPMEVDLNVKFEDVGGCQEHIEFLKEMVVFPLIYPEIFTKFSINPPRGVLFYGPPGTGKTMMARALASECSREGKKVAFFMRKGADCLSKWIGESERQLRLLFDQAYLMRPSIIFFDEIDGLAPVRSCRQDQIHSSIVSTLLALMDGLDNRGEVIVIGATNRIENIDPALRRPGRFDRELRFGLPTRDSRKEILTIHTKNWQPPIQESLIDTLADKTIGYCGADLKGLCAESALSALRRCYPQVYKTNQKLAIDVERIDIIEEDFAKAMGHIIPSTHRVKDQFQAPLPKEVRPLLQQTVSEICQIVDRIMPVRSKNSTVSFIGSQCCRPRLLIRGCTPGLGLTTYIGPAVLNHLEQLPCHKLDIGALYSNSVRTPEEALFQIFHEAKNSIPSCVYMPHFFKLWKIMSESAREALISILNDILPSAPLFLLAIMEENDVAYDEESTALSRIFSPDQHEMYEVDLPDCNARRAYFEPLFKAAMASIPQKSAKKLPEEELEVVPVKECRILTEKEEKRLRKKEEQIQRELRIFLRDVWNKINREQKFFMFRMPVDTEEVYDYLETVKQPMDFDTMLTKLDNKEYKCAQDFLDDIDLIAENAIAYNSDLNFETNKIICHRARALQDFCYALIKAEMDTDFEDECKEIVQRRKKLQEELANNPEKEQGNDGANDNEPLRAENEMRKRPHARKRTSNWAKGNTNCKKRVRRDINGIDGAEEEVGENGDCKVKEDEKTSNDHRGEDENSNETSSLSVEVNVSYDVVYNEAGLAQCHEDLVLMTKGFNVEKLERVYSKVNDVVQTFKYVADRLKLHDTISNTVIERLKKKQNSHRR